MGSPAKEMAWAYFPSFVTTDPAYLLEERSLGQGLQINRGCVLAGIRLCPFQGYTLAKEAF